VNEFRSGGHTAKETFGMRVARGGENDVACRAVFFDAIAVDVSRPKAVNAAALRG